MAIYEVKGNLLTADVQYICHQVNCQGIMNSGIAKSIKNKWPMVYKEYQSWFEYACNKAIENSPSEWPLNSSDIMLGHIQVVSIPNDKTIINMAAQNDYGYDGNKYTSYDSFWQCLEKISNKIPKGSKIGFPKNIGCCRGGANWNVIKTMIAEVLDKDYEVYIYSLEEL